MQAQLRIARLGAARAVIQPQRRLLATPPNGPLIPPTPPPVSGAVPVRPVVVVTSTPPPPGTTTLPPLPPPPSTSVPPLPPPPPPRKPRRFFRRALLYTTVGLLVFYPTSGWLSTQYETYREFFVSTFPGGEAVAEYADEHSWETFGYGTVQKKAVQGWQNVTGTPEPASAAEKAKAKAEDLRRQAESGVNKAKAEADKRAGELRATAEKAKSEAAKKKDQLAAEAARKADQAKAATKEAAHNVADKAVSLRDRAAAVTHDAAETAVSLRDRAAAATHDAAEKAKELAAEAKAKVANATSAVPFNVSDGIEGIVREAEKALQTGEAKAEHAAQKVKDAVTPEPYDGPRILPDTQRPRELRPETVTPKKPTFEGQEKYAGPPLPLGFEPPPGYFIPPTKVEKVKSDERPVLPLLVPKVKEFAAEEPIISQLASTIDSLTASLSTPTAAPSGEANGILSRAHSDLSALSSRLAEVKKAEKAKLEQTIGEKTKEFESMLKARDADRDQSEAGLKESWKAERQKLVDEWHKNTETELEGQREGIEKRLREEVVSQGIELQRRWLRSIKSQVETERGGRLAKLDNLTTSLKQLERITLDNSATLDDNVRLHKVWSALRAVQTKADKGDLAFDDELRALKALSTPAEPKESPSQTETIVTTALGQLEKSGIAQTGVKSFASLSSWFTNSVAPRVQSASLVPAPEHASVVSHLASRALSGIMFRPKAGLVEGDDVSAILARAEWCLGEKDLDGAAREVNRLKGWPARLAADWLKEARRSLEVKQALEVVGTEATLASLLLV